MVELLVLEPALGTRGEEPAGRKDAGIVSYYRDHHSLRAGSIERAFAYLVDFVDELV